MRSSWHVMVASSDSERLRRVEEILGQREIGTICSSTIRRCREILTSENVGLVFCDENLSDGDYRDLLVTAARKSTKGKVRVVLMSPAIGPDEYHAAKRSGLFEVIASPCRPTDLEWIVIRARRDEMARTKELTISPYGLPQSVAN
jgi:DNA-binding NtrC family response regulator